MIDVVHQSGSCWVITKKGYLARFRPGEEPTLCFVRFVSAEVQAETLKQVQRYCRRKRLEAPSKISGITDDAIAKYQKWVRNNQ